MRHFWITFKYYTFSVQMLSSGVFVNRVFLGIFMLCHESIFLHSFPNVMYFHGLAQMYFELCYLPRNFFIWGKAKEFLGGFGKINFAEFCPSGDLGWSIQTIPLVSQKFGDRREMKYETSQDWAEASYKEVLGFVPHAWEDTTWYFTRVIIAKIVMSLGFDEILSGSLGVFCFWVWGRRRNESYGKTIK